MRTFTPRSFDARPGPRRAAFALVTALALAPAGAQQLPWVGLAARNAQLQVETGLYHHGPGPSDYFGFAVAAGDFNADGYDDLAMGAPGNDCNVEVWDCGSVQVRFGWANESALYALVVLDPAGAGAPDPAEANDEYGKALAVGDFNADGYDDLAVGIPGDHDYDDDVATLAGAVQVHYGLPGEQGSIQFVAEHHLHQGAFGVPGDDRASESFGRALAVGDFNGDGHDDLAIGAPANWSEAAEERGGNVVVGHGHIGGLGPFDAFEMELGLDGLPDVPEEGEEFGRALAAGDFNGDGFDDLAIGVPSEDDTGAVLVVYGSPWSLLFANHWYLGQWDLGEPAEPGDRFGEALGVGDFNGDGYDDLAIGAPKEDGGTGTPENMGLVVAVYGSASGLSAANTRHYEDALFGAGSALFDDFLGSALVAADFDQDGYDDLAIGMRGESNLNYGAVAIVRGSAYGLANPTARKLRPGTFPTGRIPDSTSYQPHYGFSLATGDFDGNGYPDLSIGAPYRNQSSTTVDTGAVAVVFSQLFADSFESSSADEWSAAVSQ